MGIDIHGWIEVNPTPTSPDRAWEAVVNIEYLLDRHYDLFGCLFGVGNYAHFRPIAPARGLPDTASAIVQEDAHRWESSGLWPSWITLPEIRAINLDEPALYADSRIWDDPITPSASTRHGNKGFHATPVITPIGMVEEPGLGSLPIWEPDQHWEERGRWVRTGILQRRDALPVPWWRVVTIMETLAERFDPSVIRLVVWFDRYTLRHIRRCWVSRS